MELVEGGVGYDAFFEEGFEFLRVLGVVVKGKGGKTCVLDCAERPVGLHDPLALFGYHVGRIVRVSCGMWESEQWYGMKMR